jgi:3-phosphoshikimate 1-carboxyvinyltransferase
MQRALNSNESHVYVGAAGTAMRFLTAFLARKSGEWTLTGTERMKRRPIKLLVDALRWLGARIRYVEKEGFPPLHISGNALPGGEIELSGEISSQYVSALLMIAPLMEKGLILHLKGRPVSLPYIRQTIRLMRLFGATIHSSGNTLQALPGAYSPRPFRVEPDWSAASYWYAVAALSSQAEITLQELQERSLQGDAEVARLFAGLGVETDFHAQGATLRQTGKSYRCLLCHLMDYPDLAQTLAATCIGRDIPFRFTGLQSLRIKETDRIEALKTEARRLGFLLADAQNSILEWDGGKCPPEANPLIRTYEDHRMAMAFAPLALTRPQGLGIMHPEVVTKSYPSFWDDLQTAGFALSVHPPQA